MQSTLQSWGITPDAAGAGLMKEMWEEDDDRESTIDGVMRLLPEGLRSSQMTTTSLRHTVARQLEQLGKKKPHSVPRT